MLRDSGHEDQHADNASDNAQNVGTTASAPVAKEEKSPSVPADSNNSTPQNVVEVILNDQEMPVDDSTLLNITPNNKQGRFARLYNGASRAFTRENAVNMGAGIYNGLKYSFTTKAGLKDLGIGMALGSGLKMTAIGLGAAGILTVSAPVVFGLGVAGSVARTVWQINKERHAAAQTAGFPAANLFSRDFFQAVGQTVDWAKDNKKRALTLMGGTMLSTVGVVGGIAAITALKEWLFDNAPVVPVAVPTQTPVSSAAPHAPAAAVSHAPAPNVAPVDVDHKPAVAPVVKASPVATPVATPQIADLPAAPVIADAVTAPIDTTVDVTVPQLDIDSILADDTVHAPLETPQVEAPVVVDTAPVAAPLSVTADAPVFDAAPVLDSELAHPAAVPPVTSVSAAVPADAPVQAPVAAPEVATQVSATPELVSPPIAQSAPPVGQAFNMNLSGNAAESDTFTATLRAAPGMFKVGDKFNIELDQLAMILK